MKYVNKNLKSLLVFVFLVKNMFSSEKGGLLRHVGKKQNMYVGSG